MRRIPVIADMMRRFQHVAPRMVWMQHTRSFLATASTVQGRVTARATFGAQQRQLHIGTADTPNPNSLKFIPEGNTVMGDVSHAPAPADRRPCVEGFTNLAAPRSSRTAIQPVSVIWRRPSARARCWPSACLRHTALRWRWRAGVTSLFGRTWQIPGVNLVFFGRDFLSVTKEENRCSGAQCLAGRLRSITLRCSAMADGATQCFGLERGCVLCLAAPGTR